MASSEEAAMREQVIAWGRKRWPGARVMHELDVWGCRIDLAFVTTTEIIGVEIKSSKDVLDRLERQMESYLKVLPEVWLAFAPKWAEHHGAPWQVGLLLVTEDSLTEHIPYGQDRSYAHAAKADMMLTAPALDLLMKPELLALARSHGLKVKDRATNKVLMGLLARKLTGDQIINGICAQLRARRRGWEADEPIMHMEGA